MHQSRLKIYIQMILCNAKSNTIWYCCTLGVFRQHLPSVLPALAATPDSCSAEFPFLLHYSPSATLTASSVCCLQPKNYMLSHRILKHAKSMQHKYQTHSFIIKLYTHHFPTLRKLKGQSVTFSSKHLTTQIQGGWWWIEYLFMIGWNIFHYYKQKLFYGPTQPQAKELVGQIPSGGCWILSCI